MSRKALFFFPHNPWPPRTGAHCRVLQMLSGLRELGCHITLASTSLYSDNPWLPKCERDLVEAGFVDDVRLYRPSPRDLAITALLAVGYASTGRRPPLDSLFYTPPDLLRWFNQLVEATKPDALVINYAYWAALAGVPAARSCQKVIDTYDLVSLNRAMQAALVPYITGPVNMLAPHHRITNMIRGKLGKLGPVIDPARIDVDALQESFFERSSLRPDPQEFAIFDRFDHTIAITCAEADLIRRHTTRTAVSLISMTQAPHEIPNTYAGPALFAVGPNPFNLQGYLYFVRRVLPLVLRQEPLFKLQVTGAWYSHLRPQPQAGIILSGFVPDLAPIYALARFVVCPVYGGTGQQIKIIEAMAYGLPVVALASAAERSPLEHGKSGLVARDADEFAEHVVRLWRDHALCQRLGEEARATVTTSASMPRLLNDLACLLGTTEVDTDSPARGC